MGIPLPFNQTRERVSRFCCMATVSVLAGLQACNPDLGLALPRSICVRQSLATIASSYPTPALCAV
jgi:hypothetical protein